jgi:hypothetical protein
MSARRKKILFLLKHRDYPYACDPPYSYGHDTLSSGLYNSARLVQEMLRDELGYETWIAQARDNNEIDHFVTKYRPDICVIEAYWVTPEKFPVLIRHHPNVLWVVRNHSSMPFLALEGVVLDWSLRYMNHPNIILACNDRRTDLEFRRLIAFYKGWDKKKIDSRCVLLSNFYPPLLHRQHRRCWRKRGIIDVSCFGAIRPLKNQLIQAVAAIEFAERAEVYLVFHVNGTRIEQGADPVLRNLRALFKLTRHKLIEHPWMRYDQFVKLAGQMDLGLQVSFTETFNISAADLVTRGVPVVVSPEISWVDRRYHAHPTDSSDIVAKMERAARTPHLALKQNLAGLSNFVGHSKYLWERFLGDDRVT